MVSTGQIQDFGIIGNGTFWQYFQPVKNLAAVAHVATGQHTDHDWMSSHLVILKQRPVAFVSDPQRSILIEVSTKITGCPNAYALPDVFADQAVHSITDQSASF